RADAALLGELTATGLSLIAEAFARRRSSSVAKALGYVAVTIGDSSAVRRIVVPISVHDVGAVELIISIDVDANVAATPVNVAPDCRTGQGSSSKRKHAAGHIARRIPGERRIIGIGPGAIHDAGVIDWDVVFVRICALDDVHTCGGGGRSRG